MNRIIGKIIKAYFRALGYYPMSIGGLNYKVDPYHIRFWRSVAKGRWEPNTYTIMSRFLNVDSIYCDIGAWIGPTVIYAARICKQVICLEPDPFAYRYLNWNITLNDLNNVRSFNIALANRFGVRKMSSFGGYLGDSTTSLLNGDPAKKKIDVLALTWDDFINVSQPDIIDFLKIDIEGGEFELLPTLGNYLSQYKPIVYLSIHAPFLEADLRKYKLQQIIEVMGIYKKCYNENLAPIDILELTDEDAQNDFCSYLFMY